jgi:hypothetical protein
MFAFWLTDPFNGLDEALAFVGRLIANYDLAGKRPREFLNEFHEATSVQT